jgi:hypothetical protein
VEPFVGRAGELAELQSELDLVRRSGRARVLSYRVRSDGVRMSVGEAFVVGDDAGEAL